MKPGKKKDSSRKPPVSLATSLKRTPFRRLYLSLILVGLTLLSFSPVLQSGFLWDDDAVTENPLLHTPRGLYKIWFSPSVMTREAHYWPLVYTVFWFQYRLWALHPLGYHLVNLIFHTLNVLLLWSIFSRIDKKCAYFAALLFAVHPVHTEAVAWIIALKDVLSVTFYLAAFLLFMKFYEGKKVAVYIFSLSAFIAALFTKSMTVTLPAVLLLWILAGEKKISLRDIGFLSPFLLIALLIVRGDVRFSQGREIISFDFSLWERIRIASHAAFFYGGKLLIPINMVTFYPRWIWLQNSYLSYFPLLLIIIVLIALFLLRRYSRAPLFLVLYYLVTLSPILGFLNFYFMTFSFVADRYQYLASAGPLFLLSLGTSRLFHIITNDRRSVFPVFQILMIAALSIMTFYQASLYKNNETLFKHNIKINPGAWAAHNNLGVEYQKQEKFTEAVRHYKNAVELNPQFMDAHNNLGILLAQDGKLGEALDHFQKALSIKPNDPRTLTNIGILCSIKKDYETAVSHMEKALEVDPASANAAFNLALVYIQKGEPDKAVFYLRKTLQIDPLHPGASAKLAVMKDVGTNIGRNQKSILVK